MIRLNESTGFAHPERREKLTKKLLMSLPTDVVIVSNCGFPPVFKELVEPIETREGQWTRVVAARANGRLCNVYQQ